VCDRAAIGDVASGLASAFCRLVAYSLNSWISPVLRVNAVSLSSLREVVEAHVPEGNIETTSRGSPSSGNTKRDYANYGPASTLS